MNVNFGENVTNCGIIFDANGNYSYKYPTNSNLWIHGNNWNGMVIFPNGLSYGRIDQSTIFNKRIVLPKAVTNTVNVFSNCRNLNQNIQIPNSVTNTAFMFNSCYNLNQNIFIPNSVTNMACMFDYCYNLSNITIEPKQRIAANTNSFIRPIFSDSINKSLNIWTDSDTATNIMNAGFIHSNVKPTMTAITNGYYNARYNVYIYTNTTFN